MRIPSGRTDSRVSGRLHAARQTSRTLRQPYHQCQSLAIQSLIRITRQAIGSGRCQRKGDGVVTRISSPVENFVCEHLDVKGKGWLAPSAREYTQCARNNENANAVSHQPARKVTAIAKMHNSEACPRHRCGRISLCRALADCEDGLRTFGFQRKSFIPPFRPDVRRAAWYGPTWPRPARADANGTRSLTKQTDVSISLRPSRIPFVEDEPSAKFPDIRQTKLAPTARMRTKSNKCNLRPNFTSNTIAFCANIDPPPRSLVQRCRRHGDS
ncbi:hypothetical protein EVAR_3252_1 [Eumeta japonica]|uniref:Uncharacterized protein n=1 Tax=Eumeta variegata TaxID=151549 RepID=A0A4C1SVP9_EUMVA|nr:hypothetical protein EVAR_3252_1 [Eumeta japonica]